MTLVANLLLWFGANRAAFEGLAQLVLDMGDMIDGDADFEEGDDTSQ